MVIKIFNFWKLHRFGMAPHFTPCAKFGMVPGVIRVKVGFCGGTTPDPCYEDVYVSFKEANSSTNPN